MVWRKLVPFSYRGEGKGEGLKQVSLFPSGGEGQGGGLEYSFTYPSCGEVGAQRRVVTITLVKAKAWRPIRQTATAPPTWFFAAIWLFALAVLATRGHADRALGAPGVLIPILFFSWLTVLLTADPPESVPATMSRPHMIAQTIVVVAIATLIGLSAMAVYGVGTDGLESIPLWSGVFEWLLNLGRTLPVTAPAAISNPLLELALPLALLLALGAGWRELGFGRGHRVGWVLVLWVCRSL